MEGAATEMNLSEWISILGVLGQLLVGLFFLGMTYQIIKTVVRDAARTDRRVDNLAPEFTAKISFWATLVPGYARHVNFHHSAGLLKL